MPQERCRSAGVPTSVFFTRVASDIDRAKSVCAGCPACERCLEGAKRRREKHGVWGGQVFPQAIKSERWLKRIERSLRRLGVASVVGRDFVYLDEETSEVRFGKVPLHRLSMFCNRLEDLAVLTVLAEATEDEGFLN